MCDGTFGKTVLARFAADNLRPLHATNAICVGFKVAISPTHGCQPRATGRELEAVRFRYVVARGGTSTKTASKAVWPNNLPLL